MHVELRLFGPARVGEKQHAAALVFTYIEGKGHPFPGTRNAAPGDLRVRLEPFDAHQGLVGAVTKSELGDAVDFFFRVNAGGPPSSELGRVGEGGVQSAGRRFYFDSMADSSGALAGFVVLHADYDEGSTKIRQTYEIIDFNFWIGGFYGLNRLE